MKQREETIGGQRLILGDCLEVLQGLDSSDCFLTDPFYGVDGGRGHENIRRGKAAYGELDDTPDGVARVAVPAVKWCIAHCLRGAVTPGYRCMWLYPEPQDMGCFYTPSSCGRGAWGFNSFNPILYYGKDPRGGEGSWPTGMALTEAAEKNGHPCPKPIRAWSWLLRKVSLEGGTVLDPFLGSGTTLVAAELLGRRGIGIEIDEGYFDIACRRVEQATRQPRLFQPDAPEPVQLSMEPTGADST